MSRTNETRYIKWHETCKCKCRLDASFCNNKQRWNEDKCRCECWLIKVYVCGKGFIWNPSNCECECGKPCHVGQYLDYSHYKCTNKLVEKLVEECTENIEETRHVEKTSSENENKYKHSSCTVFIVLFLIILTINIGIGTYFVYSHWNLKKDNAHVMPDACTETTIY